MLETITSFLLKGIAVVFAIVFHEMAHGYMSYWLGDKTAKSMGRLSINPLQHIDPVGAICLLIFGFGWAKPVPIDYRYYKNGKVGVFLVALAGPLTNIILAIISVGAMLYIPVPILQEFFYIFMMINIGLGAFNLIPIPPLDGSKMVGVLLPKNTYESIMAYEHYGMFILMIMLATGALDPVHSALTQMIFNLIGIIY